VTINKHKFSVTLKSNDLTVEVESYIHECQNLMHNSPFSTRQKYAGALLASCMALLAKQYNGYKARNLSNSLPLSTYLTKELFPRLF